MNTKSVPLGQLITVIRNGINTAQYDGSIDGDMLPISRIETISEGTVDFARVKYAKVSKDERKKYQLQSGDILFSHINSPAHIGKTAIFRSDLPLIHGVNLLLLRPNLKHCHPEYLNYYLKSFGVRAWFRARCKKAVNQASLNQSDVKSLEVPLPPLPEQKRVASILGRADRLRRLRRYALELSDGVLQAVFLEMFGDPVTNPMGWEVMDFGRVISIIAGHGFKKAEYSNSGIRLLQIANVSFQEIAWDTLAYLPSDYAEQYPKLVLKPGDLLMALNRPILGDRVKFAILEEDDCPAILYQRVGKFVIKPPRLERDYLYGFMLTDYFYRELKVRLAGSDQPYINPTELVKMRFMLPPLPLQQQFAHIVHRVERLRAQQREAARQAEQLFQGLLAGAFGGEL